MNVGEFWIFPGTEGDDEIDLLQEGTEGDDEIDFGGG